MEAARVAVGCCGWTEAQSKYVMHFPTIELQSTFYQPPESPVARRWKAQAPPEFRFCMKAWQLITHTPSSPTYRRLKSAVSASESDLYGSFRPTEQVLLAWERTREIAAILDARVIVFQCPKSFLPDRRSVRNLSAFFREIGRDGRTLGWEPRGGEWKPSLVKELCAELNLIHVVDPFASDPAADGAIYWRLHGMTGYRYQYTDADLAELRQKMKQHARLDGQDYIMFNNIYAKQDALRFMAACDGLRHEIEQTQPG